LSFSTYLGTNTKAWSQTGLGFEVGPQAEFFV
jgi:hypothetical protein